jgi:hypothetical protein
MKTIHFLIIFTLIALYSCKSEKPEGKGWEVLFNGENLDGWIVQCRPEDRSKDFWTVKDGMIRVNSLGRKDHDSLWLDGPQIEIHPQGPWRTGMVYDETRGYRRWIYPDIPKGDWVNEEMRTEAFEFHYSTDDRLIWNELEIRVVGHNIQSWLNGVKMTDLKGDGILNDSIHRSYNVGDKGLLALQLHVRDELKMYYKDIFIKEL